jgi:hypothetical protein
MLKKMSIAVIALKAGKKTCRLPCGCRNALRLPDRSALLHVLDKETSCKASILSPSLYRQSGGEG